MGRPDGPVCTGPERDPSNIVLVFVTSALPYSECGHG